MAKRNDFFVNSIRKRLWSGIFGRTMQVKKRRQRRQRSYGMSIFQKIQNAIVRFMYGRNGIDQLGRVNFWTVIALEVASMFLSRFKVVGTVLYWVTTVLCFVMLWRMFSKNLTKRRAENQKFLGWWWRIKGKSSGAKQRHADKDHKYFTCKSCGAICRVPVGKGKIIITCPKCGGEIQAKT